VVASFPIAWIPEKNRRRQSSPYLWLISCRVPTSPETMLRVTLNPEPITFGADSAGTPLVWTPVPGRLGKIRSDKAMSAPGLALTISNVDRTIEALLIAHRNLIDQEVKLRVVHASHLLDPTASRLFETTVSDVAGDEENVTFQLSLENVHDYTVPTERISRTTCRWAYRGRLCGFAGDSGDTLGACGKQPTDCKDRRQWQIDNAQPGVQYRRFGGFPGIPARG